MASASTPPCGLAPIHGLPPRPPAMLHRELFLVHVILAQIHSLLQIPPSIRTIPFMSRVTHPQLRAHLEGLDNTLLLALRLNHTASPPWAFFILFNRVRNNLKTNWKAAQTLAIVHPSLHALILLNLLRLHRGLPELITPLPGCLLLIILRPLAMYHDLVFTYARDLALALGRPDLSFSVSPHTLPGGTKRKEKKRLSYSSYPVFLHFPAPFCIFKFFPFSSLSRWL